MFERLSSGSMLYAVLLISLQFIRVAYSFDDDVHDTSRKVKTTQIVMSFEPGDDTAYITTNKMFRPINVDFGRRVKGDSVLDVGAVNGTENVKDIIKGKSAVDWYFYGKKPSGWPITITYIDVLARMNDKLSDHYAPANIIITHGGVGHHEVSMAFISKLGYGFKYEVHLYGLIHV